MSTNGVHLPVHAQMVNDLPVAGTMILPSQPFSPVMLKGLKVYPDQPFKFDFILDPGQSGGTVSLGAKAPQGHALTQDELRQQTNTLIKYFLTALTVPEKDLWVNLSPYEKDRIIPDALAQTTMGRELLAQDYVLKQFTASIIHPERELGKEFWKRVYSQAEAQFGTTHIPVNTFNKVWIIADKANVFERNNAAFITGAHLKVMMDSDYLATAKNSQRTLLKDPSLHVKTSQRNPSSHNELNSDISHTIMHQIILPEIEKEVNEGKNFAPLRQMFYSMILASWYKQALKESLITQAYANKSKVSDSLTSSTSARRDPESIYQQYLLAYKKGVFNLVKEDIVNQQPLARKYFSGGLSILPNPAMIGRSQDPRVLNVSDNLLGATVELFPDSAMTIKEGIPYVFTVLAVAGGLVVAKKIWERYVITDEQLWGQYYRELEKLKEYSDENDEIILKGLRQRLAKKLWKKVDELPYGGVEMFFEREIFTPLRALNSEHLTRLVRQQKGELDAEISKLRSGHSIDGAMLASEMVDMIIGMISQGNGQFYQTGAVPQEVLNRFFTEYDYSYHADNDSLRGLIEDKINRLIDVNNYEWVDNLEEVAAINLRARFAEVNQRKISAAQIEHKIVVLNGSDGTIVDQHTFEARINDYRSAHFFEDSQKGTVFLIVTDAAMSSKAFPKQVQRLIETFIGKTWTSSTGTILSIEKMGYDNNSYYPAIINIRKAQQSKTLTIDLKDLPDATLIGGTDNKTIQFTLSDEYQERRINITIKLVQQKSGYRFWEPIISVEQWNGIEKLFDSSMNARSVDNAALSNRNPYGGIDLNRGQMQMNVTRASNNTQAMLNMPSSMRQQLQSPDFQGFDFMITALTPLPNILPILGVSPQELQLAH